MDSVGRTEQLASVVQKQAAASNDDVKHMFEELEAKFDEQFSSFASNTRHTLQESRQDARQHMTRQLEERLRPLSDQIAEASGQLQATARSEKMQRLQKTCLELEEKQESLARQCSATAQEVS